VRPRYTRRDVRLIRAMDRWWEQTPGLGATRQVWRVRDRLRLRRERAALWVYYSTAGFAMVPNSDLGRPRGMVIRDKERLVDARGRARVAPPVRGR
jgi:hypothetical protein